MTAHTTAHRVGALAVGTSLAFAMLTATPAVAAPDGHASCMALESAAISPPGSSDEFPGGRAALNDTIAALFPGVPRGVIYRIIAHLHEGSHEACDAALEG